MMLNFQINKLLAWIIFKLIRARNSAAALISGILLS